MKLLGCENNTVIIWKMSLILRDVCWDIQKWNIMTSATCFQMIQGEKVYVCETEQGKEGRKEKGYILKA